MMMFVDLEWWIDFVFTKLASIRPQTRALVRVLDARGFAKDVYYFASDENERTLQQSFKHALALFQNVTSVLLDDHTDLDPGLLIVPARNSTVTANHPLMLSISGCPFQLPNTFFNSPSLQSLVYLDVSTVPGSILPLIQPALLPELRILKVRNREIDNQTLIALVSLFRLRLWSLDISGNKVSDDVVDTLRVKCFPVTQLRSDAYSRVEGKLAHEDRGTPQHGPFIFLEESEWSGSFNHPERYFVDAPMYMAQPDQGPQEYQAFRSSARGLPRRDTPEAASTALSEGTTSTVEDFRHSRGTTHLHLSNNLISATGIEKLVRISNGQLDELSCDYMPLLPHSTGHSRFWPKGASLHGILGAAHVFRPVLSSNLRVLRIHHSLVTNIPTLELEGLSTLARLHIVENIILPRVMMAYPQTYVPDMNPRLSSLTLTHIPRRSSGPLISKLISFLKLLSVHERSVQVVREEMSSWRAPGLLQGLRHLRLEFEPDPLQDGFSALEDLDAEGMMNSGDRGFSFFEDEREGKGVQQVEAKRTAATARDSGHSSVDDGDVDRNPPQSVRDDEDFLTISERWNGTAFSIPVWVGKSPAPCPVLDDYRKLVLERGCRDGVGPVTPAQVRAGAPDKSYVFHTAWCLAIMPLVSADRSITPPSTASLSGMRDVLDDLREYRLSGRAKYEKMKNESAPTTVTLGEPHYFWTGRLEVSREDPAARTRPSQYWR